MLRRVLLTLGFFLTLSAPAWAINCAVANGACFWVGGTGTMDFATDSAHWSNSTGGGTCSCEPISTNSLTFDGSSGGGTITVNATVNATTFTMSAFTGTMDFAPNDNNVNLSAGFANNGSGTRTLNMGDGTWTITGNPGNPWLQSGATNLTLNANASTLVFAMTGSSGVSGVSLGTSLTYNIITCNANANGGVTAFSAGTAATIGTLNLVGPNVIDLQGGITFTVTTLNLTGGSSLTALLQLYSNTLGIATTLSIGNASTPMWSTFRDITKTGAGTITATNSIDLGHNTGFVSITAPATGGSSGGGIIGG